ncbi:MAG: hypothetical protein CM15mP73_0790 [Hyphomicrobiales bacterium]|nr:MAG: hypothetical protein CM15mP73_0790 [Hyphomicrobiales bacterium]
MYCLNATHDSEEGVAVHLLQRGSKPNAWGFSYVETVVTENFLISFRCNGLHFNKRL